MKSGFLLQNVGYHTNTAGKKASGISKVTPEASLRQLRIPKSPLQSLKWFKFLRNTPHC